MKPIHPDDPDWATALLCTPKQGQKPRLRSRRRPIVRLLDEIKIVRWVWYAGGRVASSRKRNVTIIDIRTEIALENSDDGSLLHHELAQPQAHNLKSYVRPRCKCGAWLERGSDCRVTS